MPSWKIEFLATAPVEDTTSGLSRVVWELGGALARRGHQVRVLYPSDGAPPPAPPQGVVPIPVPVGPSSRRPFGRDIAIGRNASDLLDPQADVIVGNDEKAGALWWKERPKGRPAFVMMVHDVAIHTFDTLRPLERDRGVRQRVGNWLDRRALRRLETTALERARLVLIASDLNRKLLAKHYKLSDRRVQLVPYGVPDPLDVGSKSEARQALKVPVDVPAVAFVGRNAERQGLPLALEAFRRVRPLFPGARFLIVGSAVPAEPGVMPLGTVDELTKARVLRASDIFLFPARYEGYGLAPREAMRYGIATIVSKDVPFDGLDPKRMARIVETQDAGEYASALAELLADPALCRSVGEAGRRYSEGFTYDAMAERLEGLLMPLLR